MNKLSKRSKENLIGVHPDLVKVVELAIERTGVDFIVTEGLRTQETQNKYYSEGKSRTLTNSRHLKGSDGYGHAIDLMAVGVKDSWDFEHYYTIAQAIQESSKELNIPIRWGGAWHYRLNEETITPKELCLKYQTTQRETGKSIFLDGVHFELPLSDNYPK